MANSTNDRPSGDNDSTSLISGNVNTVDVTGQGIGLAGRLAKLWTDRARPHHLICRVTQKSTMLAIKKNIRDKVRIAYENQSVRNLAVVSFSFENSSNTPIVKPTVTINFSNNTRILGYYEENPPTDNCKIQVESDQSSVKLEISWIRPKIYKHIIRISVVCDSDLSHISFSGGTENWAIQEFIPPPAETLRAAMSRNNIACLSLMASGVAIMLTIHNLYHFGYKIPDSWIKFSGNYMLACLIITGLGLIRHVFLSSRWFSIYNSYQGIDPGPRPPQKRSRAPKKTSTLPDQETTDGD